MIRLFGPFASSFVTRYAVGRFHEGQGLSPAEQVAFADYTLSILAARGSGARHPRACNPPQPSSTIAAFSQPSIAALSQPYSSPTAALYRSPIAALSQPYRSPIAVLSQPHRSPLSQPSIAAPS